MPRQQDSTNEHDNQVAFENVNEYLGAVLSVERDYSKNYTG